MKNLMIFSSLLALTIAFAIQADAANILLMSGAKFNSKHLNGPVGGTVEVDYENLTVTIAAKSSKGVHLKETLALLPSYKKSTCGTTVIAVSNTTIGNQSEQQIMVEDTTGSKCKTLVAPNGSYTTYERDTKTGKLVKFQSTFNLIPKVK